MVRNHLRPFQIGMAAWKSHYCTMPQWGKWLCMFYKQEVFRVVIGVNLPIHRWAIIDCQVLIANYDYIYWFAILFKMTKVRLLMLPSKKQKHKTKIRTGESPQFMESFLLHRVNPEEVNSMGLRVRVYGCERMRRERLIGESIVSFATIDLELETNLWLPLEPRANATVSQFPWPPFT